MKLDKLQIAHVLEEIGVILELKGENPFKVRAYTNAARILESLEDDLDALIKSGELLKLRGIGKNLANNTFQALIADKFEAGPKRSRAANLYEVVRMVGLVMAAGILGVILQPYSAERLTMAVIIMAVLATLLAIIATVGQEPRTAVLQEASAAARAVNFKKVVKDLVWDDPQARQRAAAPLRGAHRHRGGQHLHGQGLRRHGRRALPLHRRLAEQGRGGLCDRRSGPRGLHWLRHGRVPPAALESPA